VCDVVKLEFPGDSGGGLGGISGRGVGRCGASIRSAPVFIGGGRKHRRCRDRAVRFSSAADVTAASL
jgi:hypothetical protein